MKITDNYEAKFDVWVRESKVHPLPKFTGLPKFRSRKFASYAEFNSWKRDLLDRIARQGGVTWTT